MKSENFRLALATDFVEQGANCFIGRRGVEMLPLSSRPSILISYHYILTSWTSRGDCSASGSWDTLDMGRFALRDWFLDSGAFSAWTMGKSIDLGRYRDFAKLALAQDPKLLSVFSLDVIGDWRATLRNTERLWSDGLPVIPTYHVGAPQDVLLEMARTYPKIALGGAVGMRGKHDWAKQCFARVWPKPIHGLGFGSVETITGLPWHSVDATSWSASPVRYGTWRTPSPSGKRIKLRVRGSNHDLRTQVEFYLKIEKRMNAKWRRELESLNFPQDCRKWPK